MHYGYFFVFGVLFVESLGIPAPSEITLVTAGILAGRGEIQPILAILAGASGSTAGALVAYLIAVRGGRRLLLRYGSRVGLTEERLDRVESFFQRWGLWAVVVGRVLSGVRALISYPAGIFEMPFGRFLAATIVGALIWPIITVSLGSLIGSHWQGVLEAIANFGPWIAAAILTFLALWVVWRFARRRSNEEN